MHYKPVYVLLAVAGFLVPALAKAQIGWTPQQMEAKYGKSVSMYVISKKLIYVLYNINQESLPTLAGLGATAIKTKFFEGKAVEISVFAKELTREQFKAISLAMLDDNPRKEFVHDFEDFKRDGNTIMSYGYKKCNAMYLTNSVVLIEVDSLTPLGIAVTNEEARIKDSSQRQQTDALQKELRGKK